MSYKLGSLFDGSGGFPLAGSLCGIEPRWASEVEPYPIAVTRARFPNMKHLGDISKINGAEIEPVDIITFGSPCQDLSVAGKRAGLKHEANGDEETTRSGLFMEAVRIIKEMRESTNGVYPKFALWENVTGAFSSNKGEDFRVVCEELIKIVEPAALMPPVPKNGWPYADSYVGDGWNLAYRVFDAQYWGVPQRRRRIHLVVDFRGERAQKVLFERKGMRGYFAEGRTPWKSIAADAEGCTGAANREGEGESGSPEIVPCTLKICSGCEGGGKGALIQKDKSATLATNNDQYLFQPVAGPTVTDTHILDDQGGSQISVRTDGKSPTLRAEMHGNVPAVMEPLAIDDYNFTPTGEQTCTLRAGASGGACGVTVVYRDGLKEQHLFENHSQDTRYKGPLDVCPMLPAQLGTGGNNQPFVVEGTPVYCLQGNGIDRADTAGCNGKGVKEDICYTLNTIDRPAVVYCTDGGFFNTHEGVSPTLLARAYKDPHLVCYPRGEIHYIVRRLTPTECARLQGFADWWSYIEPKETLTDAEYEFWQEVRNTHAAINGKAVKDYTKVQMLTWYNKLYTDSTEYKMWGNGIALPPALYCLQGIHDVLNAEAPQTENEQAAEPVAEIKEQNGAADHTDPLGESQRKVVEIPPTPVFLFLDDEPEEMEEQAEEPVAVNKALGRPMNAVEQLKRLAAERQALARLHPESDRFLSDVQAIEYAVNVLEAVGL